MSGRRIAIALLLDWLAALLQCCLNTPTLRVVCLVHNAVQHHALHKYTKRLDHRIVRDFSVYMHGSGAQERAWVINLGEADRLGLTMPALSLRRSSRHA